MFVQPADASCIGRVQWSRNMKYLFIETTKMVPYQLTLSSICVQRTERDNCAKKRTRWKKRKNIFPFVRVNRSKTNLLTKKRKMVPTLILWCLLDVLANTSSPCFCNKMRIKFNMHWLLLTISQTYRLWTKIVPKVLTILYLNSSRMSSSVMIADEKPRTMTWMDCWLSFTTLPSENQKMQKKKVSKSKQKNVLRKMHKWIYKPRFFIFYLETKKINRTRLQCIKNLNLWAYPKRVLYGTFMWVWVQTHSTNDHFDNNIGGSEKGQTKVGAFSVLYCCFDFIKIWTDTSWSMHIRIK